MHSCALYIYPYTHSLFFFHLLYNIFPALKTFFAFFSFSFRVKDIFYFRKILSGKNEE